MTPVAVVHFSLILIVGFHQILAQNRTSPNAPQPQLIFPARSSSPSSSFDLCVSHNPCKNGGQCFRNATDAVIGCICPPGWEGQFCERNAKDCPDEQHRCVHGDCKGFNGVHECWCAPGYTGRFCDIPLSLCRLGLCKNSAECKDLRNDFECICPRGFTGKQCELDVDECQPRPCRNGATCINLVGDYNCSCPLGFMGRNCEVDIDNCESKPCVNGRCIDGVNNFTCNCVDTGFTGRFCEQEMDDCAAQPCLNGGNCTDIGKGYVCRCFDGYMGRNCEVDINECLEPFPPCQNGGTCIERSNISLYHDRKILGLDRAFSYANSAGFICQCPPGFKGAKCEVDIDECETKPCINGVCGDALNSYTCSCFPGWEGKNCEKDINECLTNPCSEYGECLNTLGSFQCRCRQGYGGRNCSIPLSGCGDTECANGVRCPSYPKCAEGATCVPFLESEDPSPVHNFTCVCPIGRAGRFCQSSSIASFSMDGFLQLLSVNLRNLSFDFRTTLNDSLLMAAYDNTGAVVVVQLVQRNLQVVFSEPGVVVNKVIVFDRIATDGKWRRFSMMPDRSIVVVTLMDLDERGMRSSENKSVDLTGVFLGEMTFTELYFGGLDQKARLSSSGLRSNMVGCLRDISLNGQTLVPADMNSMKRRRHPSVRSTCDRKEQCGANTCNGRGQCSDLWNRYECICRRPYYGLSCEKEIPAGTFRHEGRPSAVFLNLSTADHYEQQFKNSISFRIRTLEADGVIFYLGSFDGASFVQLSLVGGSVAFVAQLSNVTEVVDGPKINIADGGYHWIELERDPQTMVRIVVDEQHRSYGELSTARPLRAEQLILGRSLVDGSKRTRRQDRDANAGFKGILQDFRMNGKLVPIFEVPDSGQLEGLPPMMSGAVREGVEQGVVSDDLCRSNPCTNGGTCEVTWNSFKCICPVAYRGRLCEQPNFCLFNECPSEQAQCRKLENDYECLANVSFLELNSYITYIPTKIPANFRKVSFRFRTRSADAGNILSLTSTKNQLKIYLKNSRIQLDYRFSPSQSSLTVDHPLNDALWHFFQAEFLESVINLSIDDQRFSQDITTSSSPLSTILSENGAYVQLGGDFIGCLDDVRIGTFLLPIFPESKSHKNLPRILQLEKLSGIEYGCRGIDICKKNPCAVGKCVDIWNARTCECGGSDCEIRSRMEPLPSGPCSALECINGVKRNCDVSPRKTGNSTEAYCECFKGYVGERCETPTHISAAASPVHPDQLAIILGVTISVGVLLILVALIAFCITARRKRAERGTYSPSRQEIIGSRVEMGYVLKPPPEERLI